MLSLLKRFTLLSVFLLFFVVNAKATVIPFTDNHDNWDNWAVKAGDLNGTPDFLGGTATVDNSGYLTGLTFDVKANLYIDLFKTLTASDLFIDANADDTWDYVVKSLNQTNGTYGLYSISQPLGSYDSGNPTNTNYIQALQNNYRKYHPIGLNVQGPSMGTATLSGWWGNTAQIGDIYTLNWSIDPILLGHNFTIAFSVMCANDVVYEKLQNPVLTTESVPEPASLVLIGSGMIGLFVLKRKKS